MQFERTTLERGSDDNIVIDDEIAIEYIFDQVPIDDFVVLH